MIDFGVTIPNELVCLPSTMYVTNAEYGERKTSWGFEIPAEQMDFEGNFVRPRWFKVLWKADNIKNIEVGDWVLISYGLWSSSIKAFVNGEEKTIYYISPKSLNNGALMARSKEMPKVMSEYI